jgi:hypothetical protein
MAVACTPVAPGELFTTPFSRGGAPSSCELVGAGGCSLHPTTNLPPDAAVPDAMIDASLEPDAGAGGAGGSGGNGAGGAGGTGGSGGSDSVDVETPPSGYVPALVGVGYGGLRIVSRDSGLTWSSRAFARANGADDEDLLRAVAYGNGRWVTTGWKLWTSDDGVQWTDHGRVDQLPSGPPCSFIAGLAYHAGFFYAACTPWGEAGRVYRSTDGVDYVFHGEVGSTDGNLFLSYNDGTFAAYGDSLVSYSSTDATTWTQRSDVVGITYCEGRYQGHDDCGGLAWFDGVWFRQESGGYIERSTDGRNFQRVYADPDNNTLYRNRALAKGYVAP